ncbi:MAG TPA: DUF2914 domain-containing protein [Candidatus Nanoarchaeia archaeon]|nr:DUF2914 domain-containing protein [Candidatus Nanoarchaeia archaeon]
MRSYFYRIKNWVTKHERKLSSLALFAGFILDALTLRRIDNLYENGVFITYFLIICFSIFLINYIEAGKYENEWVGRLHPFLLLLIQFAFGGLFSGFSIFYFRSGSLLSSWPFIIILFGLLIGNERLRKQYERLVYQVSFLFLALFFFAIFAVPVLVNRMGSFVFVLSGVIALLLVTAFVYLLNRVVPDRVEKSIRPIIYSITVLFLLVNVLYFTNLIPPIPLSLKDAGVYHAIQRIDDKYIVQEEDQSIFGSMQIFENIHIRKGVPLFVYSSVFAPNNLTTTVVHNWKFFDSETNRWVSVSKIPYTVIGGPDRGYRGYTKKANLQEGQWTVNIETERGQVIGRVTFEVVYDDDEPRLVEKVL